MLSSFTDEVQPLKRNIQKPFLPGSAPYEKENRWRRECFSRSLACANSRGAVVDGGDSRAVGLQSVGRKRF